MRIETAPRRAPATRPIARPAALVLLALLAACAAERRIDVTSRPPGAEVWLDGRHVGETPASIEFSHYGARRLTLRLGGHLAQSEIVEISPPWYGRFPLDFVSEVLLPFGWKDVHRVHFVLAPGDEMLSNPTLRSVVDRAEALRQAGPGGPRTFPPPVEFPALEDAPPEVAPLEVAPLEDETLEDETPEDEPRGDEPRGDETPQR